MIEILLFCGIFLGAFLFCERWLNELTGGIAEAWQEKFFLHIRTLLRIKGKPHAMSYLYSSIGGRRILEYNASLRTSCGDSDCGGKPFYLSAALCTAAPETAGYPR